MRNNFCRLREPELKQLDPHVPADLMGMLWSPFHMSERNGYIWVPTESFQEITHFLTDHAVYLTALKKVGEGLPARSDVRGSDGQLTYEAKAHNACLDAVEPLVSQLVADRDALRARVAELEAAAEALP